MTAQIEPLFTIVIGEECLLIPAITKDVVSRIFAKNEGPLTSPPDYAANPTSYGEGPIIKPPGTLVKPEKLIELRNDVIADLESAGFKINAQISSVTDWDRALGESLKKNLKMSLVQENDQGVWAYLTLYVFWEFPTWRYHGRKGKGSDGEIIYSAKRWEGGNKNVLRKCWMRASALGPDLGTDGLSGTVEVLNEDELVNVFERTTLARNRDLLRAIVQTIYIKRPTSDNRMFAVRRFATAVLHRTPTTHFGILNEKLLPTLSDIFDEVNPTS